MYVFWNEVVVVIGLKKLIKNYYFPFFSNDSFQYRHI